MAVGRPNASRVIGKILKDNPNPIMIPCHRVVKNDGRIGGYAYGKKMKRILLEFEGIKVRDERIIEFEKVVINLL